MRKSFSQYFRPQDEDLQELWKHGLLSFDASVLLNIYGYSSETRSELIDLIEKNSERLCLPHQFGLEYARNRSVVIIRQVNNYLSVEKELRQIRETHIAPKRDHPYLTEESLKAYDSIQKELEESRRVMEKLIGDDPYADRILQAFDGKVGSSPSGQDLTQLEAEAQRRYTQSIPPGFEDLKEKATPEAYGDYIGWYQLLEIAKSQSKGVILVIDDLKKDWWQIERERMVGPRPELQEEFSLVTQQRFYMYTSEGFLRAAKKFMAADIPDETIEEVKARLRSIQQQSQSIADLKAVFVELKSQETDKMGSSDKMDAPSKMTTPDVPAE